MNRRYDLVKPTLVSVILPTYNEEKNIKRVIRGIWDALLPYAPELKCEVVVVDDGDDKTSAIALSMGARVKKGERQGLGQAIIDGIRIASGDIVVVMDADGSHPASALPDMLKPILWQGVDMTIGSRYVKGGGLGDWSLGSRVKSIVGAGLMSLVTGVKDSNSGYFAFRREVIEGVELRPSSWKIMLEVLFKGHITVRREVPITFGERWNGESKNNIRERIRHAKHLIGLLAWKFRRFIQFTLVGGTGNIWHYGLLWALTEYAGLWYGFSLVIAIFVAMTNNYLINHYWTFRGEREANKNLLLGWVKFIGNSAIGDYGIALPLTIGLASGLGVWYMLASAFASVAALFFKYFVSKNWIWKSAGKKRKAHDPDYEWVSFYHGLPWQKIWKHTIANAVKKLAGDAGRTLDIGSGSSPAGLLVNHADYVGLDSDRGKMAFMKKKIMQGAQYDTGSVLSLHYPDDSFDTVLFVETIEHLRHSGDVQRALVGIRRVLKHGGTLIVATPNYGSFMGRMQDKLYGIFQRGAYADEHKVKFTPEILKETCGYHGFVFVDSIIPMGSDMVMKFRKGWKVEISGK